MCYEGEDIEVSVVYTVFYYVEICLGVNLILIGFRWKLLMPTYLICFSMLNKTFFKSKYL